MIDLRSDTVTRPTPGMIAAMSAAPVGDDVWGDDPTVNRLQSMTAEMTGKEAALFFPSGTQSNLAGLMSHCERGDEYIVGQMAHTYRWEGGGAAVLGSIQPQPLEQEADGTMPLAKIAAAIKPFGPGLGTHFARTKLLALENTWGGRVLPQSYVRDAATLARSKGLNVHLDGARAFNAAVASETTIAEILAPFDSASLCISKGLGAPAGALLVGDRAFIERAHRWRKMLGGGMRQSGYLAAACIYAFENNVERLRDDHANAAALAAGLGEIAEITVFAQATNVVFLNIPEAHAKPLEDFVKTRGMLMQGAYAARLVTHLDVSHDDVKNFVTAVKDYFARAAK
ncbi:MAG: low-specificity L-threonine aldolase [Casimicrobium sp.]